MSDNTCVHGGVEVKSWRESQVSAAEKVRGLVEGGGDEVAVPDCKADEATDDVEGREEAVEILLGHGSSDEESGIDESEVARVRQELRVVVVDWEPVARAVHDANELRN